MEWFTRSGQQHTGTVLEANEAKGTARYEYMAKCSRCGGAGGSDKWRFTGWTCFECGGSGSGGVRSAKLYTAEKLAKLNESQAKRDAKRSEKANVERQRIEAERRATRDRFEAGNADFVAMFREWHTANLEATGFLADVWEKFQQYGNLSEKQMAAVKGSIERNNERRRVRESSQHIGEVGKRMELTLTCEKIISFPPEPGYRPFYATTSIHLCRDENGNRVVYKGNGNFPGEGETGKVLATIKEHGERDRERQTIIARPKVVEG